MFEIVLYEPEIPPNTGNIMRLCANTGCRLHLVRPLGFSLSDKQLARAGMDYRASIDHLVHDDWKHCLDTLAGHRIFAVTTRGSRRHDQIGYAAGDGRWSAAAYVDNVTNEAYRVYAFDSSLFAGVVAGVYGKPRTYGLTATWRFGAAYN